MDLAYRSEAKRSHALAVVVAFLAVLFGVSQFGGRDGAERPAAHTDRSVTRLQADVVRTVDGSHRGLARKMIGLAP
jgi:hypothetical protein